MSEFDIASLEKLPGLSGFHYYPSVSSTNDLALEWLKKGAEDLTVVLADEQSSGRGRMDRKWVTRPGSSLAFSVILKPQLEEQHMLFPGLGAVAVCDALAQETQLPVEIKWPNDILIHGKKVCGILTEAQWEQDRCLGVIMGIGVNVGKTSMPPLNELLYPASSIETESGKKIQREKILAQILRSLIKWRISLGSKQMLEFWQNHLAYLHQDVRIEAEGGPNLIGKLDGIGDSGDLRIITKDGTTINVDMGDVHLRLMDQPN